MQCPNCKEELKEGYLYCENCGYEIQMVPDFEPEVDGSILTSMRDIQKEVEDTTLLDKEEKHKKTHRLKTFKEKHKMLYYVFVTFCVCFCACLIGGGVWLMCYLSPNFQYNKAMKAYAQNQYKECLEYVERTVHLDETFKDAYVAGYQCSILLKDYEEAKKYLLDGVTHKGFSDEEIIYCFDELIQRYIEIKQFKEINKLLILCPASVIVSKYHDYLSLPVNFSYAEGTYVETIPLTLSATNNGNIYYTTDGTIPTNKSKKYVGTIFLDVGQYEVNAIFINDYGVESELVTKKYFIENRTTPYPPSISAYSGEYVIPEMISIDYNEGCSVYYTTDGTVPTKSSLKYEDPIPMPLGKTQFKFICYNDESGFPSDVVTREYNLVLNTEYEFTQAQRDVYALMINEKIILDYAGTRSNFIGKNAYEFQYAISVEEMGEFYLIKEVHYPEVGPSYDTGVLFAVNVYDRTIYRAEIDENLNYVLTLYGA